jgi:hypothetical protein
MWLVAEWLQHEAILKRLAPALQHVKDISTERPPTRCAEQMETRQCEIKVASQVELICFAYLTLTVPTEVFNFSGIQEGNEINTEL